MRSRMVAVLVLPIVGLGDISLIPVANARLDDGTVPDDSGGSRPLARLAPTTRG